MKLKTILLILITSNILYSQDIVTGDFTIGGGSASTSNIQIDVAGGQVFDGFSENDVSLHTGALQILPQVVSNTTEESLIDVSIFPNPVTSQIVVSSPSIPTEYRLLSTKGELISSGYVEYETITIEASSLAEGTYFIQVEHTDSKAMKTYTIIKQ